MARSLKVEILGDSSSVERAFGRAGNSAQKFGMGIGQWVKGALIFKGVDLAVDALSKTIRVGIDEWKQQADVAAQTAQVLKTTGGVANVTAGHVDALAQSIMRKSGIDDEAVKTTENLLLGFTNIRNEAGKGNDVFDRATRIVTDYATRTGKSAASAAIIFGKALQDPSKYLGALGRSGITFTKDQAKMIAGWVKHGDILKAQTYMLDQVEKRFKGAAEAAGKTLPGKLRILREEWRNMSSDLLTFFLPVFSRVVDAFSAFTDKFSRAKGFKAKIEVVWGTAKGAVLSIQRHLSTAIAAVDWVAVWGKAKGIAAGLQARFDSIDWGATGAAIGDGIAGAVDKALSATSGLPSAFESSFRRIDWVKMGRAMGPGLAAAVVSAFVAITDPGFWIKNWDLALAVALTVFGGAIGKIAGKFMLPLRRVMSDAITAVADWIDRQGAARLAYAILAAMERLPGVARAALRKLEDAVSRVFGRLSGIAKFTLKVLGIQLAIGGIVSFAQTVWGWINKIVDWFKGLPGRIIGAVGNVDLSSIGRRMVQGIIDGMGSKIGDLVSKAGDVVNAAKRRLEFWKSPPEAYGNYIGSGVAAGIASGLIAGTASVVSAAGSLVNAAKVKMNAEAREVARIQAQIDAAARAREDRDNAKSLADANKQLAEARKKGKGIADAEQAVADALAAIRDTARQRDLDKAQKNYDRLQKAYDAAQARLEKAQQKAADRLQKLRDKSGDAFDKLAAKIQRAFDAKNNAWVAPSQAAIDSITARRQSEDMQQAVTDALNAQTDAQKAYDDAQNKSDYASDAERKSAVDNAYTALLKAQRDYQRAVEDITLAGYEAKAAIETRDHQREVDAQQEALDTALENLRTALTTQGTTWDKGLSGILGVISTYVGPFGTIGDLLGDSFTKSLMAAVYAAVNAAAKVAGVQSPISDQSVQEAAQAALDASKKQGQPAWQAALAARGAGMNAAYGLGGSNVTKNYNLNISGGIKRDVDEADMLRMFRTMERIGA